MSLSKRLLAAMVAGSLLVGTAGTAFAAGRDDNHGRGKKNGHVKKFYERFSDWQQNYWANEALARMIAKGIIQGNADGTVAQDRHVTKLEAAIMLVRLLGLDNAADTGADLGGFQVENDDGKLKIEFDDEDTIPAWGRSAIAIALEQGFLVWDGKHLNPMKPLSRLDAAVMLVKAAGLDAEAQARAGATLPFVDAPAIPYAARGYVAIAVEKGFINGMPDQTFQPNKKLTRAQWAAMLDRLDRKGEVTKDADKRQVKGSVTAVNIGSAPSISMTTPVFPGGVTYPVDDTAVFYVNGAEKTIADIHAGDQVLVQLSDARTILMVTVVQSNQSLTGSVTAYTAPSGTQNGVITIQQSGGASASLAVAANAQVTVGSQPGTLSDVRVGDTVTLTQEGQVVTRIAVQVQTATYEGTVSSVTPGTNNARPVLAVLDSNNVTRTYAVADHAAIVSAAGANLTMNDVTAGTRVRIDVERNLIVKITVLTAAASTVSGTVYGVTGATSGAQGVITITTGNANVSYAVANNAAITWNNSSLALTDLRAGDGVTLTLSAGVVTAISVTSRPSQNTEITQTGVVRNLNTASQSFQLEVTTTTNGTTAVTTYNVTYTSSTVFALNNIGVSPAAMANGQRVTVTGNLVNSTLQATRVDLLLN